MIKDELLKLLGLQDSELSHPADLNHGDFSTNIALKQKVSLDAWVAKIPKNDLIEKVEIIKPGFINFFIKKERLVQSLDQLEPVKKGKKNILLEYGQPNTHKVPHIGHLFSYVFGESLARILSATGHEVSRLNYQGDIGLHVAKCLYAVKLKSSRVDELTSLEEKVKFLQECYQEGSSLYETDKNAEEEIDKLNIALYQEGDELWRTTREWSLEFYKQFEEKLGINFDKNYFESETAPEGLKLVKENIGKVFEESDGAVIFNGEKHGLHTRVFITKHGLPTYEAKDIGLMKQKQQSPFDLSIVTTASEQNDYWKVIIKAAEILFPALEGKLKHIGYGLINLKGAKMSSRTGTIIDAFSLVNEVKDTIAEEYEADEELSEKVALAAIKYSFLRSESLKNIIFDIETSVAREGDSGPYLLYTYVRTQSIIDKILNTKHQIPNKFQISNLNEEESDLLRTLYRFPEVVEQAARSYSPHLIAGFVYNVARLYNLFYQKHSVLKAGEETKKLRLMLTKSTGEIIKQGLYLLGIETVNKM